MSQPTDVALGRKLDALREDVWTPTAEEWRDMELGKALRELREEAEKHCQNQRATGFCKVLLPNDDWTQCPHVGCYQRYVRVVYTTCAENCKDAQTPAVETSDALFDRLYDALNEGQSVEDMEQDLREQGIDVERLVKQFRVLLEAHRRAARRAVKKT